MTLTFESPSGRLFSLSDDVQRKEGNAVLHINENWRIVTDERQWIVQKFSKAGWKSRGYAATKIGLINILSWSHYKIGPIFPEAKREIKSWPDHHREARKYR